jgi:hypothetical protein
VAQYLQNFINPFKLYTIDDANHDIDQIGVNRAGVSRYCDAPDVTGKSHFVQIYIFISFSCF